MKSIPFFIAFFLLFGCENSKKDNDASKEENTAVEEKADDRKEVEVVKEPPFYIAFREEPGGTVYLTDSDDDIDRLIVDLRPLGVEVALLEPSYWKDPNCRRMSARKCSGGCEGGNCVLVMAGNWNVCRCQ